MKSSLSASETTAKQQCTLGNLYSVLTSLTILYAGGLVFYAYKRNWLGLCVWLILLPCARWVGLRLYPFTAEWRGYGSLADKLPLGVKKNHVEVTFYSHNGCPFCPILRTRLKGLQKEVGFVLTEINLTLKPQVAKKEGIRSVPVVRVGDNRLFGNATTEQLAQLIAGIKSTDAFIAA
jgi:glutaredoxin